MFRLGDRTTYPQPNWNTVRLHIDSQGLSEIQRYRLLSEINNPEEYEKLLVEFGKLVIITVSQFYKGKHFYLRSNQPDLVFDRKFDTYEEAEKEALKHAVKRHIYFNQAPHRYNNQGD